MLFELSEARRPVNLKERVKDRVSRNTLQIYRALSGGGFAVA